MNVQVMILMFFRMLLKIIKVVVKLNEQIGDFSDVIINEFFRYDILS